MAGDCIFCKIAEGAIPSHKVYEDAQVFAFLDIHPLTTGHTLVIPKRHVERFEDLGSDEAAFLWRNVHRITPAVTKATGADGATLAINNGRGAGQEVPHVHVHVVPRSASDGAGPIHALFSRRPQVTPDGLAALATRIQGQIPAATATRR